MSIHGPRSLRRRETSTRTLLGLPSSPCRSAHSVPALMPSGRAQSRARISASRGRSSVLAAVDLEQRAVAAEQGELARAGARRPRAAAAGADDERLVGRADGLGDRDVARGQRQAAAAGRDREAALHPPARRDLGDRPARAGHERARVRRLGDAVAVARAQAHVVLLHVEAQPRLDGLGGRGRDGEAVRVDVGEVAREVDDAEQAAGVGVVDRSRRARPALHDLVEVLGAEDLDGVVGGDRGADRVRARAGLAPQRALGEVHVVGGAAAQARAALDAQQHAAGVGDDDEVAVSSAIARGTRGSAAPRGRADGPASAAPSRPRRRRPARVGGRSGRCPPRPSAARSRRSASRTSSGSPSSSGPGWPSPATKRSQAKRSSRARSVGAVPTSIASQDFELIFLLIPGSVAARCDRSPLPEEERGYRSAPAGTNRAYSQHVAILDLRANLGDAAAR